MSRDTRSILRQALVVITLTAVGWSGAALAAPAHGARHGMAGDPAMAGLGGRDLARLLDEVGASAEQRSQIEQIAVRARADLAPERDTGRSLREQALQLFTQPTLDPAAAEALRQQQLAWHDRRSQRMLQAMLDIGEVLTPDQRQQWAGAMQTRRDARQHTSRHRDAAREPGRDGGHRPDPAPR